MTEELAGEVMISGLCFLIFIFRQRSQNEDKKNRHALGFETRGLDPNLIRNLLNTKLKNKIINKYINNGDRLLFLNFFGKINV